MQAFVDCRFLWRSSSRLYLHSHLAHITDIFILVACFWFFSSIFLWFFHDENLCSDRWTCNHNEQVGNLLLMIILTQACIQFNWIGFQLVMLARDVRTVVFHGNDSIQEFRFRQINIWRICYDLHQAEMRTYAWDTYIYILTVASVWKILIW